MLVRWIAGMRVMRNTARDYGDEFDIDDFTGQQLLDQGLVVRVTPVKPTWQKPVEEKAKKESPIKATEEDKEK